jgi:hypothetical protein
MSPRGHQSHCRPLRRSAAFLAALALGIALVVMSFVQASLASRMASPLIEKRAALVAELSLTDLALFTEARYTRHPSQADLHSAFQDHPMALDHFPSGSLVPAAERALLHP